MYAISSIASRRQFARLLFGADLLTGYAFGIRISLGGYAPEYVVDILGTNRRKPSEFNQKERNMRSWWKHNKKLMNAGELKPERQEMLKPLLELGETYKHVNQYQ